MDFKKRISDYGISIGVLPRGELNSITDVAGVKVGHSTLADGPVQTGVTAVIPHGGSMFSEKVPAASYVINGFGKSAGLIQIDELGSIETPIILTNTFAVGAASQAVIQYMMDDHPNIGKDAGTVNPVVCECNDGFLNDIRALSIDRKHIFEAIAAASTRFDEGSVGAGRGMSCYQLKGGIGSASRMIEVEGLNFTIGALVLSNYGLMDQLRVGGRIIGPEIRAVAPPQDDDGSIIAVIATDIPLTERQLGRLARRASVGITRTGAFVSSGSGEIALAFTTANKIFHDETEPVIKISMFNENNINLAFQGVAEVVEEAVLNSMVTAAPVTGRDGNYRRSLAEFAHLFKLDI